MPFFGINNSHKAHSASGNSYYLYSKTACSKYSGNALILFQPTPNSAAVGRVTQRLEVAPDLRMPPMKRGCFAAAPRLWFTGVPYSFI
jgi:hypothetical protein